MTLITKGLKIIEVKSQFGVLCDGQPMVGVEVPATRRKLFSQCVEHDRRCRQGDAGLAQHRHHGESPSTGLAGPSVANEALQA